MSKTKKKKKYTPRPVYYPAVIIAMHSFEPLEKAIEELLYAETIQEDHNGDYVFVEPTGRIRNYDQDLFTYIQYIQIYGQRTNQQFDITHLLRFRKVLQEKLEFKESEVKAVIEDIKKYKILFSKIPSAESREILKIIRQNNQSIQQQRARQKQLDEEYKQNVDIT